MRVRRSCGLLPSDRRIVLLLCTLIASDRKPAVLRAQLQNSARTRRAGIGRKALRPRPPHRNCDPWQYSARQPRAMLSNELCQKQGSIRGPSGAVPRRYVFADGEDPRFLGRKVMSHSLTPRSRRRLAPAFLLTAAITAPALADSGN